MAIDAVNILASCCSKNRLEGNPFTAILFGGCSDSIMCEKAMTPSNAEALIIFLFYCLAVHLIHLERRKQR